MDFIEINSNPGEKIQEITGINYYVPLLEFVEKNYKRKTSGNGNEESLSVHGL